MSQITPLVVTAFDVAPVPRSGGVAMLMTTADDVRYVVLLHPKAAERLSEKLTHSARAISETDVTMHLAPVVEHPEGAIDYVI